MHLIGGIPILTISFYAMRLKSFFQIKRRNAAADGIYWLSWIDSTDRLCNSLWEKMMECFPSGCGRVMFLMMKWANRHWNASCEDIWPTNFYIKAIIFFLYQYMTIKWNFYCSKVDELLLLWKLWGIVRGTLMLPRPGRLIIQSRTKLRTATCHQQLQS